MFFLTPFSLDMNVLCNRDKDPDKYMLMQVDSFSPAIKSIRYVLSRYVLSRYILFRLFRNWLN